MMRHLKMVALFLFTGPTQMRLALSVCAVTFSLGFASAAFGGTITDGNATFSLSGPNARTPLADFRPEGGTTTDYLFQNWWFYRLKGANQEELIPWLPMLESYKGNTARLFSSGIAAAFRADLVITLKDSAVAGQAEIVEKMTIENNTSQPLSLSLFNYADIDVAGTSGNDRAVLRKPGRIRITDGTTADFAEFVAAAPTAFQVTSHPTLIDALEDMAVTNLNNTGLPFGPGDWTGAFQWDLNIPVDGKVTVVEGLVVNMASSVPEPGTLGLLSLGVLSVLGCDWWRRKQVAACEF